MSQIPAWLNLSDGLGVMMRKVSELTLAPTEELSQNIFILSRNIAAKVYNFQTPQYRYGDSGRYRK